MAQKCMSTLPIGTIIKQTKKLLPNKLARLVDSLFSIVFDSIPARQCNYNNFVYCT